MFTVNYSHKYAKIVTVAKGVPNINPAGRMEPFKDKTTTQVF